MPKVKTHKSLTKRIKKTGSNKLIARHMSVAHRARFKSKRSKQNSLQNMIISAGVTKKLRKVVVK